MKRSRPWLVLGRSHEHEWNGRVGSRFASEERARVFAARMEAEGWWDVRVYFAPTAMAAAADRMDEAMG